MNLSKYLKAFGFLSASITGVSVSHADTVIDSSSISVKTEKRPNIILILADDMGFSDLSCYGSEIDTPNLNSLAAKGIRFSQFYNSARCCPTRASLLTGLHPHQAGIGWMTDDWGAATRAKLDSDAYSNALNHNCVTIAEALQRGNYNTLMSGKWHVGYKHELGQWPVDRGFDHSFVLTHGASSYYSMNPTLTAIDGEYYDANHEGFYITDEFTNRAINYVEDVADDKEPFFLYLAYTSPHWPLHAQPEDIAKYRGKYKAAGGWPGIRTQRFERMKKLGILDKDWELSPVDSGVANWSTVDQDQMDLRMSVYAAQIDRMDQNIGRLLKKLDDLGERDNTLILFLADNGACAEYYDNVIGSGIGNADSKTAYWRSWANTSNTPFRMYKHWAHEGGISTGLIANWPAGIHKHGMVTNEPGHIVDIMATCLDVAKTDYPKTYKGNDITPLEGLSLVPIFETGTRPGHETICIEHEGHRCCRKGKWKLVAKATGSWELYDIDNDRTETNNLVSEHPDIVAELEADYDAWAARCNVRDVSYWQ